MLIRGKAAEVGNAMVSVGAPWKKKLIGLGLRLTEQRSQVASKFSALQMETLESRRVYSHGIHGRWSLDKNQLMMCLPSL